MTIKPLKIAAAVTLALAFSAGTASAGDKANCDKKKHTAMKTDAAAPQSAVLSSTAKTKAKTRKTYTFDEAVKLCTDKGAKDLQACIDYKTGQTTS